MGHPFDGRLVRFHSAGWQSNIPIGVVVGPSGLDSADVGLVSSGAAGSGQDPAVFRIVV